MDILKEQIKKEQTTHGYIFESRDLDLAKKNARDFVGELLLNHTEEAFYRDLMYIKAEKNNIKISSIREMIRFFQTKPFYGDYKIAIIEDGSKLRVEASNAMLRILEELPSYGKIIILVRNAYELLPTIRSRCQIVKFDGRVDYQLDVNFVQGLIESFLLGDLTVIVKNREKVESMKDYGSEFFAIAIDYLMKLRLEDNEYDDKIIESSIDKAIYLSNNLNNNVNFLLSVECFALGFID